ncbi:glycoside hydrolase family 16 protein [Wenyingzhuangia sp. 2_MG-2023]|uniref:glycoside hydrolase family 16 protein n=1 Tax=Wenyingzhuangia sp. 2_MG-2023 TaxID=3062639 RepID=UPI0026E429F6|nr:glycoside hydrolase family 16 protein [Wenyingzhuangia sp. 2_MG-2023]MDO6737277.1 glycoside hydrolase family 16 protein [Wenyingzhuangia sp. 2_MG-2023]MDO6801644.1 glycoside hydrolase family 16 protein [Wenyingzhuangia sp. 1_MG-2023]
MEYKQIITAGLLLVSFFSCGNDGGVESVDPPEESCNALIESAIPTGDFTTLVWADEFDVDGSPCLENWSYDIGASGWGNNESQYYTREADNVKIEDGVLKITAKKQLYNGAEYTSARLITQEKYGFTYGKVEVRAKLPDGGGTWPAIWMLGENISTIGWPACGEIDIMEHTGNDLGITSSAIHTTSGSGGNPSFVKHYDKVDDVATAFHVYGINWTAEKIEFTVDGVVKGTYQKPTDSTSSNWPFYQDQFLILNLAMGGTLGGDIDPDFTESTMEVDYVRVYQ